MVLRAIKVPQAHLETKVTLDLEELLDLTDPADQRSEKTSQDRHS